MKNSVLLAALILCTGALLAQPQSVGIGTTTPHASSILDVNSTTKGLLLPRMTGDQRAGISSPADGLIVYQTDNSLLNGPRGFYVRENGAWKRMAKGEELGWIVSGTNIYTITTGTVGIGTNSPNATAVLDLTSTTRGFLAPRMTSAQRTAISSPPQGLMVFQNNGTSSLGFWYHDGTTWQRFAKASELTGSQSWTVTGDDQYSNVDGNVGIGLSTGITEKLTLRGDLMIQNDTVTDNAELLFTSQTGISGAGGIIRFLEPDGTTTGGLIQYRPNYNVLSLSNELSDDAAIYIYENENIGIGGNFITDAVSKLQIQGGNPIVDYDDHGFLVIGPTSLENLAFGNDEILARNNGSASTLTLQEDGGTVKIGNGSAADTKLHLTGTGESSLTTHGYLVMGAVSSLNMVMDANEIQARNSGFESTLRLQQDGGSLLVQGSALVVATNGNVGIGDLTPDEKLHVAGNALLNATNPTIQLQNEGIDKGFIQLSGDHIRIGTNSANDFGSFVIRNNGADRVWVSPSGNMGIGVASPGSKLDVAGRINIGASGEALKIDGNDAFMQFYENGVAKSYLQQLNNDLRIGISSGNTSGQLKLSGDQIYMNAGEVAINVGADGPAIGYSLSVGGEIICEELRVELQGSGPWPDYVFAEDYKLTPLHELKSFIEKNRHLPNIPAAAQVEDEGFDVGDMNKRLLEKVEELTLYVIKQQEEIDALKKLIID